MRRGGPGILPRVAAVAAALGLLAAVIFADSIGLGPGAGTGRFRVISAILATGLLTYAILGGRFGSLFRAIGLVSAWAVVVALSLEVASFAFSRLDPARSGGAPARVEPPWGASPSGIEYEPFTGWGNDPCTASPGVILDAAGLRTVPGSSTDPSAFTVYVYGGDAVLGASIADSATIPCFIQEGLDSFRQGPVRVENRARPGWTSTQALVDLVLSLRSGAEPDFVLFIGGFEDASAAWSAGAAGGHLCMEAMGSCLANPGRGAGGGPWRAALESTETWGFVSSMLPGSAGSVTGGGDGSAPESLGVEAAGIFLSNAAMAGNLGRIYGFECRFCWLPGVLGSGKPLAPPEQALVDAMMDLGHDAADFAALLATCSEEIEAADPRESEIVSLASSLDSLEGIVFTGSSGTCMTADGNQAVARAILAGLGY